MNLQEYESFFNYLQRGQYRHQFFPGFSWMEGCPYGLGEASRIRSIDGLARRVPRDRFVLADLLVTAWELLISEAQNFPHFRLHEEFFLFVNVLREAISSREGLPQMAEFDRPEGGGTPHWVGPMWYDGTDSVQPPHWIPVLSAALGLDDADLISAILATEGETEIGGVGFEGRHDMNDLFEPIPFPFYELAWQEQRMIEAFDAWLGSSALLGIRDLEDEDFEAAVDDELRPIVNVLAGIYAALQVKMAALGDPNLVLRRGPISWRSRGAVVRLVRDAIQAFIDRWIDLVLCRYPVRGVKQIEFRP